MQFIVSSPIVACAILASPDEKTSSVCGPGSGDSGAVGLATSEVMSIIVGADIRGHIDPDIKR